MPCHTIGCAESRAFPSSLIHNRRCHRCRERERKSNYTGTGPCVPVGFSQASLMSSHRVPVAPPRQRQLTERARAMNFAAYGLMSSGKRYPSPRTPLGADMSLVSPPQPLAYLLEAAFVIVLIARIKYYSISPDPSSTAAKRSKISREIACHALIEKKKGPHGDLLCPFPQPSQINSQRLCIADFPIPVESHWLVLATRSTRCPSADFPNTNRTLKLVATNTAGFLRSLREDFTCRGPQAPRCVIWWFVILANLTEAYYIL